MSVLKLLDGKDVLIGVIDVATDRIETPEEVADVIAKAAEYVPAQKIIACTNCGMAPMRREIAAMKLECTRPGRGAGACEIRLILRQASKIQTSRASNGCAQPSVAFC